MRLIDRRLVRLAGHHRWLMGLVIGSGGVGGLCAVAQAVLLAQVIAAVFLGGAGLVDVKDSIVALTAAIAGRAAFVAMERLLACRLADGATEGLRARAVDHLCRLGPVAAGGERTGEIHTILTEGLEDVHGWFEDFLPQVALSALVPLIVAVVVLGLDSFSAIVLLVTAPLIPLFMVLIGRLAEHRSRRQLVALGRLGAAFLDLIQGLPTLALMGRAGAQAEVAGRITDELRRKTMTTLRLAFLSALALELLATLSTAVVAVEVGLRLLYGRMEFAPAFAVLLLAPEFYLPLRLLGQRFHSGMAGVVAADRLFGILETQPPRVVGSNVSDEVSTMPDHPTLRLERVSVSYPAVVGGNRTPVLRDVDLQLSPGETVALVGASGAGKSTVVSVLLRFLAPESGRLTADGVDAASISPEAWRSRFSWVPQRPWLMTGTVLENLRLANPTAGEDAIREAIHQARADELLLSLPLGWNTPLGERGVRLSGGQAQRLALARAFLKGAPIVLFDEPDAGLDAHTLAALDASVERLLRGRSALIVAHRLATVERADRVVVLEGGKVADQGSPSEILHRPGPFHQLLPGRRGAA